MNNKQEFERFLEVTKDIKLWFIPVVKNKKRPLIRTKSTKDAENRLSHEQATNMISGGGNVGVFGLQDGLMIIDLDCESHWINFFPPTLTTETWSGRYHLYYKNVNEGNSSVVVKKFTPKEKKEGQKDHEIEFRGHFHYVLSPGSHVEDDKKNGDYRIIKYLEPQEFSPKYSKILTNEKAINLFNGEWQQYDFPSRSEAELSLITLLVEHEFKNNEIKRILKSGLIAKASEKRSDAYLERSIEKARKFLVGNQLEGVESTESSIPELEEVPMEVVWGPDLLKKEFDDMKWYVEGYIPEKGVVMWAGKRASAKTWLALKCAVAMAAKKPFLDKFETDVDDNTTILYIDEENGEHTIKDRLIQIMKGMGIENGLTNFGVVSYSGIKLDNSGRRMGIESFLQKNNPCIIFVDSLKRVLNADENNAGEMNNVFTEIIRPISEKYNVTWILQHHLRKGVAGNKPDDLMDELRGSSEIVNYADVVLIFDKIKKVQNRYIFHQAKCRRAAEQPSYMIELRWEKETGSIFFDNLGAAEDVLDTVDICAKAIMEWTEINNVIEFKTKDIREAMIKEKMNQKTVARALTTLVEQEKLNRIKRGVYFIPGASAKFTKSVDESQEKSTKDSLGTTGHSIINYVPCVPNSNNLKAQGDNKDSVPSVPLSLSPETGIKELIDALFENIKKFGPVNQDDLFASIVRDKGTNLDRESFDKIIEHLLKKGLVFESSPGELKGL